MAQAPFDPPADVVSHTPALLLRMLLDEGGRLSFAFLSEACESLLGLTREELLARPERLIEQIEAGDREIFVAGMHHSALQLERWDWEGRICIEKWQDVKWVSLRASPSGVAGSGVQWDAVMTNVTRSKQAEEEIRHSRYQLAELSAHVEKVKEAERARIAREIHDDLGGNLTAIKMALAQLSKRLPEGDLRARAAYVDDLVDRTIEATHRISSDLRPAILDLGIVAALRWQAHEFARQTSVPCAVFVPKDEPELPMEQATALFRIFQEALTNVAKHAGASRVEVALSTDGHFVRLSVSDDGKGIAGEDLVKPSSFGLRGMRERTAALGGSAEVHSIQPRGTCVAVRLPCA